MLVKMGKVLGSGLGMLESEVVPTDRRIFEKGRAHSILLGVLLYFHQLCVYRQHLCMLLTSPNAFLFNFVSGKGTRL